MMGDGLSSDNPLERRSGERGLGSLGVARMEGGGRGNLLDPAAAEFHPTAATAGQLGLGHPQIYYAYAPPPPPPPHPPVVAVPVFHLQQPQQVEVAAATRAVALSMVPRHVGEAEVRAGMEAFGGVRAVEMGALAAEGVVIVHFFDLRSAEAAVAEVREQHARQHGGIGFGAPAGSAAAGNWAAPWMWCPQQPGGGRGTIAGHPVWAQFAAVGLDDPNQGSLIVLNSDTTIPLLALREIFEPLGAVKEAREMPSKPQHRVVEFFDTRDAARAIAELNGKEINGRRLLLEFSRHGSSHTRSHTRSSPGHAHGHHGSPLPPRFLRGSPQPSRWAQASGGSPRSSSSSLRGESSPGSVVVLKRTNTTTTPAAVARSGSSSGRRNKNSSSSNYPAASSSSSKQQQQQRQSSGGGGSGRRSWKNRSKSSGESRFLFKEAESEESSESSCRDSRTTVMIKNIPNKYSQKLLLNMLDNHCIQCNEQLGEGADEPYSAYDFVYLPIDFNNKCNVGYGFVNLTSPEAAFRLYKAFHLQPWEVFNSRKICQVTYARLQGLEALKEHFRNSKFACDNDEYMPVVFSPPRDGRRLTEPVPVVVGREQRMVDLARAQSGCTSLTDESASQQAADSGGASSTTTSTHAPSDNPDGGDDDDDDDDSNDDEEDGLGMGRRGDDGSGGDETGLQLSQSVLHLSCN
ncbi:unnamed protein product [Musa acuminata var. zebrina]